MISSRYHSLSLSRSASRSYFVHDCLWRDLEHRIHRLAFGSDIDPGLRTPGCVRALLLLTEWHPRALQFPVNSTLYVSQDTPTGSHIRSRGRATPGTCEETRWREEVFDPAKRADRMSWMMLGMANSLSHELEVQNETDTSLLYDSAVERQRIRRLLCLHVNQLALTLGCNSFLPFEGANITLDTSTFDLIDFEGEKEISLWLDLTSLSKMAKSVAISGRSSRGRGSCNNLLDDLQPLLNQWFQRFQDFQPVGEFPIPLRPR